MCFNKTSKMTGAVMLGLLRAASFGVVCLIGVAAGSSYATAADTYPNRPVRWLIGFAPGGPVDIVARIMAQWLSDHFGQQFVVENRSGSGGNIATATAITSPADGYTLLFSGANNAISASLYKRLPFDFIRDTVPVASFMQVPNMLVVSNAMPVKTVAGYEATVFYGISAPKGTPGEIVDILNRAVGEALRDPKLVARFAEIGGLPMPLSPDGYGKLIAEETEKWRKVVAFAGVSVD